VERGRGVERSIHVRVQVRLPLEDDTTIVNVTVAANIRHRSRKHPTARPAVLSVIVPVPVIADPCWVSPTANVGRSGSRRFQSLP